jgi:polysaccharide export outer membrane protein
MTATNTCKLFLFACVTIIPLTLVATDASRPAANSPAVTSATPELRPFPAGSNTFATMDTLDDKHKLTLGDKLSFRIIEDQEDPKEPMDPKPLVVTDHGDVEVPYIGRFPAVGKTCKQLGHEIKVELEKKYYYQATVMIGLDQFTKTTGKVYVLGEVRLTGMIEMPGDETLTVGKAVLRAGGFTNYADKRNVKVTRKSDSDGPGARTQTIVVNLTEVFEKGRADKDVELQPGDLIFVPSRLINF